jgi:hypothetical protein
VCEIIVRIAEIMKQGLRETIAHKRKEKSISKSFARSFSYGQTPKVTEQLKKNRHVEKYLAS